MLFFACFDCALKLIESEFCNAWLGIKCVSFHGNTLKTTPTIRQRYSQKFIEDCLGNRFREYSLDMKNMLNDCPSKFMNISQKKISKILPDIHQASSLPVILRGKKVLLNFARNFPEPLIKYQETTRKYET